MTTESDWKVAGGDNVPRIEPSFSDPEDFVDDIPNEELMPDIMRKAPMEADGIENAIIVRNIPVTEKIDKLKKKLQKDVWPKVGNPIKEEYPVAANPETGKEETKGYCFLEYEDEESALKALETFNGYRFDKRHNFEAYMFTDFEKYERTKENWEDPTKEKYRDLGNTHSYLQQEDGFDQFVVTYEDGKQTEVFLNTRPEVESLFSRRLWSERGIDFSSTGVYMVTYHTKGVALWAFTPHFGGSGGDKHTDTWTRSHRFQHEEVDQIDFSPDERYLTTCGGRRDGVSQSVIIWDILTQKEKRKFQVQNTAEGVQQEWPHLKWSHDSQYVARSTVDTISIYELPHCGLLDKKSIKVKGLRRMKWSPKDNLLSYWVPEQGDGPARVTIVRIPSRLECRVKNLFNVQDIDMVWQDQGKYLAVRVDRPVKGKRSTYVSSFEIFHMEEKEVPVETIEVKDCVTRFMWEPQGKRLCALHGEAQRVSCSIFDIKQGKVQLVITIPDLRSINCIFWSPAGQYCLLVQLQDSKPQMGSGAMMFLDTSASADKTSPRDFVVATAEHPYATDIEWDPTGRYVVSYVSHWIKHSDNEYVIWSFLGRRLRKVSLNKLVQFVWRPRPPSLLSSQDKQTLKKELKTYTREFEIIDRNFETRLTDEEADRRKRIVDTYQRWHEKKLRIINSADTVAKKKALRDGVDTDTYHDEEEEVVIERIIKEEETVVDPETIGKDRA